MRTIKIPIELIREAMKEPRGACVVTSVKVDWPEVQLTQQQIWENSAAKVFGKPQPHPDNSIFLLECPYVWHESCKQEE